MSGNLTIAHEMAGDPNVFKACCIGERVEHNVADDASLGLATARVKAGMSSDDRQSCLMNTGCSRTLYGAPLLFLGLETSHDLYP